MKHRQPTQQLPETVPTQTKTRHHLTVPETLLILLGLLLVILLVFVTVIPNALHLKAFVVSSDSMAPVLNRGDLIFVKPTPFSTIQSGDIITFSIADTPTTHRVYSVDTSAGTLRTKADASSFLDPTPITADAVIGSLFYRLPKLGQIQLFFKNIGGQDS